jgi:hypothetical protein
MRQPTVEDLLLYWWRGRRLRWGGREGHLEEEADERERERAPAREKRLWRRREIGSAGITIA